MSTPCPYCGCEFRSAEELIQHRNAALRRQDEVERAARIQAEADAIARAWPEPLASDAAPPPRPDDPGGDFLRRFFRGGGR